MKLKHITLTILRWGGYLILFFLILTALSLLSGIIYYYLGDTQAYLAEFLIQVILYTLLFLFARYLMRKHSYSFRDIFGSLSFQGVPWLRLAGLTLLVVLVGFTFAIVVLMFQSFFSPDILPEVLSLPAETQPILLTFFFHYLLRPLWKKSYLKASC